MNLKYYWYLKNGTLKESIVEPGINNVEEIGLLKYQEDNSDENTVGESSESDEESSIIMLFGKTNNKLIKELFAESSYCFWYEKITEYESKSDEYFILPKHKNGIKNCIILETKKSHLTTVNRDDTCKEDYLVRKKLYHCCPSKIKSKEGFR